MLGLSRPFADDTSIGHTALDESTLNNDFQKEKKTSQHHKEVSFLIETILDNIHSPTLAGNNYAVSNATIASDYSGMNDYSVLIHLLLFIR
jgi:hypothetical protein